MKNEQQKLGKRKTYTPTNTSQICSPVVLSLNREETLSEQDFKTFPNNLDVNQHQRIDGLNVKVFVQSFEGFPLMPCTPAKARHLLKSKKAVVLSRKPFTIKLNFVCENQTQPINLGIDAGYKKIGYSATTKKQELICGELELRTDVSKKLQERAMYRKAKRNKLWYRQPRFNNRTKSKKNGWLTPSIQHKLNSHIRLVEKIKTLLPISNVVVEVASFDQQKMMNPEISGIEYQQGTLQGYMVKEYLLEKYKHTCQYCQKTNVPLEAEHIIAKCRGGSDRVSNLTIACHPCNQKKDSMSAEEFGFPEIQQQCLKSLKAPAFMNSIKKRIVDLLNCEATYGYITKYNRINQGLLKTHYNDAFMISRGTNQTRCKPFFQKQTRRNNRCLQTNRKGYKPSIRRQKYALQPNDRVTYKGKIAVVNAMFNYGKWIKITDIQGNKINTNIKNAELLFYGKGITFC